MVGQIMRQRDRCAGGEKTNDETGNTDGDGRVMFERILWLSCLVAATAIIVLGVQEINALRSRVLTAEAIIFDWRENYVIWPKAGLKTK